MMKGMLKAENGKWKVESFSQCIVHSSKCIVVLFAMLMLCSGSVKAQIIAVNTDLVCDGLLAPNFGVELGMTSRSTLSVNALSGSNILFSKTKMTAVQPEWRFYFSGRRMYHHFVGIGLIGATYETKANDRIYNGDGAGAGVTFGYVLPISKHFNIDFHAGCGAFYYRQKEYYNNADDAISSEEEPMTANSHGVSFVPTRIGISLTYIIK